MAGLGSLGRILVTGASGFLGGHVVRRLLAEGVDVIATARDTTKLNASGCATHAHDISRPFDVSVLPEIDCIVHCAALSAPFGRRRDFIAANVDGTRNVIALARAKNVSRFVHISTPSVYFSLCDQIDVSETYILPPPVNFYAETKALAEEIVLDNLAQTAVLLRPRGIYGPGDIALLPRLLRAAAKRPLPLLRGGRGAIDLTYVDDVVNAIVASLIAPKSVFGNVFNISSGEVLPIRDIVEQTCAQADIIARWRSVPLAPAMAVAGIFEKIASWRTGQPEPVITRYGLGLFAYRQSLDINKAKSMLGWTPSVKFADGLARTFAATR